MMQNKGNRKISPIKERMLTFLDTAESLFRYMSGILNLKHQPWQGNVHY